MLPQFFRFYEHFILVFLGFLHGACTSWVPRLDQKKLINNNSHSHKDERVQKLVGVKSVMANSLHYVTCQYITR